MRLTYMKLLASTLVIAALAGCNSKDDPGERVFRQYLKSRAAEAQVMIDESTVGTAEGEYREGTPESLQVVVDKAVKIYWDENSSQIQVDLTYGELAEAIIEFEDSMYPFISEFRFLIQVSKDLIADIAIGEGDGMIPLQSDKDSLQIAVRKAEDFLEQNELTLTQRQLDVEYNSLQLAMYAFEGKIPGAVDIQVENPSFEQPAPDAQIYDNFDDIPGWNNAGWMNEFNPWGGLWGSALIRSNHWTMSDKSIPEGNYVMQAQTYCKDVWQLLSEGLHTDSQYKLNFMAARGSEWSHNDLRLRVQFLVFTGNTGDFNKAEVLREAEIANIYNLADFTEQEVVYNVDSYSEFAGKRIVVAFRGYVTKPWNTENDNGFVWKDDAVMIDCVSLTREKRSSTN